MVVAYHLYKYPYRVAWQAMRLIGRNPPVVCYCGEPVDYVVFEAESGTYEFNSKLPR